MIRRVGATSEVLEQGEVGEAVGEHATDAVDVDDRLIGPLLHRRPLLLRRLGERSHRSRTLSMSDVHGRGSWLRTLLSAGCVRLDF